MALTPNLGLYKPSRENNVFVSTDISGNMDIIDNKVIRTPVNVGTISNSSASAVDVVVSVTGDYSDMVVLGSEIGDKHAFNSLSVVFSGSSMEVHANVKPGGSSTLQLYMGYQVGGRTSSYTYNIDIDHDEWQELDKIGSTPMGTTATTLTGAIKEQGDLIKDADKKMAIVVNGNTSDKNISQGDYVILENSTISALDDGLYISISNVTAGTPLTYGDLDDTKTAKGGFNSLRDIVLDAIYPVGSVYISFNNTLPSAIDAIGTWKAVAGGYVLKTIASGTGGATSNAGNTGDTTIYFSNGYALIGINSSKQTYAKLTQRTATAMTYQATGSSAGSYTSSPSYFADLAGSQSHHHTAGMPANVAVYMWKRTA